MRPGRGGALPADHSADPGGLPGCVQLFATSGGQGRDHAPNRREETAPMSTVLSETVDLRTGLIRARGHLTAQAADLLRGTADSLRGRGHARVVLDLRG